MAYASIDVDGMTLMISRLEITADRLHHTFVNLYSRVSRAGIDTRDLSRIGEIAAWIDDELPGLRRRLNLAIAADAQRSQALQGTPVQIDEPAMTMAEATAVGRDLATRLTDADLVGDLVALNQLAQELATYSGDPDVMAALYDKLGAGGTLDVLTQVGQQVSDPEELAARTALLEALKGGLSTAQISWTDTQSRQFATTMVDLAARQGDASAYDHAGDFAAAMSYLLYDSHHSDAFLGAAGDRMDYHERVTFNGWPEEWTRYRSAVPNQWLQYFPEDVPYASWDPGVSLMSALENNPQAALDFFTDPTGARQRHWIGTRPWPDDQFAHLSTTLVTATTDPGLIQPPDSASAADAALLASWTVNLLGARSDLSPGDITGSDASDVAAENFAAILATYMNGVEMAADPLFNTTPETGGGAQEYLPHWSDSIRMPNTPAFDPKALRSFVALAASTESGFGVLRLGADDYAAQKYAVTLASKLEDPTSTEFRDAVVLQGGLEGLLMRGIGESQIAEARGEDAVARAWIALGNDSLALIPFGGYVKPLGVLAAPVVSFTTGRAREAGVSALEAAFANAEVVEIDKKNGEAAATYQRTQYQAYCAAAQYPSLLGGSLDPSELWVDDGAPVAWETLFTLGSPEEVRVVQNDAIGELDRIVGSLLDADAVYGTYLGAFNDPFSKE